MLNNSHAYFITVFFGSDFVCKDTKVHTDSSGNLSCVRVREVLFLLAEHLHLEKRVFVIITVQPQHPTPELIPFRHGQQFWAILQYIRGARGGG